MGFSVDQLVADCVAAVQDSDGHSGVAVEEVVARAISDPVAIEAAIGHPRDLAVFSTWFNSEELTVLHVVWPPAVDLMAHDHLMWATIGLYGGREDNRVFRSLPDGTLEHRRTKTLRGGDTSRAHSRPLRCRPATRSAQRSGNPGQDTRAKRVDGPNRGLTGSDREQFESSRSDVGGGGC